MSMPYGKKPFMQLARPAKRSKTDLELKTEEEDKRRKKMMANPLDYDNRVKENYTEAQKVRAKYGELQFEMALDDCQDRRRRMCVWEEVGRKGPMPGTKGWGPKQTWDLCLVYVDVLRKNVVGAALSALFERQLRYPPFCEYYAPIVGYSGEGAGFGDYGEHLPQFDQNAFRRCAVSHVVSNENETWVEMATWRDLRPNSTQRRHIFDCDGRPFTFPDARLDHLDEKDFDKPEVKAEVKIEVGKSETLEEKVAVKTEAKAEVDVRGITEENAKLKLTIALLRREVSHLEGTKRTAGAIVDGKEGGDEQMASGSSNGPRSGRKAARKEKGTTSPIRINPYQKTRAQKALLESVKAEDAADEESAGDVTAEARDKAGDPEDSGEKAKVPEAECGGVINPDDHTDELLDLTGKPGGEEAGGAGDDSAPPPNVLITQEKRRPGTQLVIPTGSRSKGRSPVASAARKVGVKTGKKVQGGGANKRVKVNAESQDVGADGREDADSPGRDKDGGQSQSRVLGNALLPPPSRVPSVNGSVSSGSADDDDVEFVSSSAPPGSSVSPTYRAPLRRFVD